MSGEQGWGRTASGETGGRKGTIGGKGIVEGRGMDGNGRQMKRWKGHSRRARRIRKGGGLRKEKKWERESMLQGV